tara:strand:+ start:407 stop:811 length:405 start_codon:yes stop_codon:yes gene_type:complete
MFNFGYPPKNWDEWEGEWGMVHVKAYWGARAIYGPRTYYMVDLLPDRQTWEADTDDDKALADWLKDHGMPWLRKTAEEKKLPISEPQEIKLISDDGRFELRANTNGSYGYLYIGAIEKNLGEALAISDPADPVI